jgi:hypothetical protein
MLACDGGTMIKKDWLRCGINICYTLDRAGGSAVQRFIGLSKEVISIE